MAISVSSSFPKVLISVLFFCQAGTVARFARAEPGHAAADAARALYRRAEQAMTGKNWSEAHRLLMELWETTKTHDVAASLAVVEYQLGRYVEAARNMTFALQNLPPKEKPEVGERYRKGMTEIRSRVGTVVVSVDRSGAEVRVDGAPVGLSPLGSEVHVPPGTHEFEARDKNGSAKEAVTVAPGETRTLRLLIGERAAPSLAPRSGTSSPNVSSETAHVSLPPSSESRRSDVPIYVGVALSAVGFGMAAGFGLAANGKADDARAFDKRLAPNACNDASGSRDDCRAAGEALDAQRRSAIIANVGLGVGVAAGLGTLAYVLFWPPHDTPPSGGGTNLNVGTTGHDVIISGSF